MTVSNPTGYRIPSSLGLPALSRRLVSGSLSLRRDDAVHIIARILAMMTEDGDAVVRTLSQGLVGDVDLVVSNARQLPLVARAAEFVDVLHASLHGSFVLPPDPWLDLRFELRFFDDPADANCPWTYVLLGTESEALEKAWQDSPDVQPFGIVDLDEAGRGDGAAQDRGRTWARVSAPFARAEPVSWAAPEPQLLFDILDSISWPESDDVQAEEGKVTVPLVAAEARRLGCDSGAWPDLSP